MQHRTQHSLLKAKALTQNSQSRRHIQRLFWSFYVLHLHQMKIESSSIEMDTFLQGLNII